MRKLQCRWALHCPEFDTFRSSKSALHGLIHWLANIYAKKGITVNGVAPALITDTAMLPGTSETLSSSEPFD